MTNPSTSGSAAPSRRKRSAAPAPSASYSPVRDPSTRPIPGRTRPVSKAVNGSMVQDFADAQRLGREMLQVKTNDELRKEGLVPDPIQ